MFPGHPGLPQDHARWSSNRIYSNNRNWYTEIVDKGVCAKPMAERGYINGTVCPVVPTPVGTGVLIAGGNFNSTDHNYIYDNWRYGTMQFWVPAPLRDEYDPAKLNDTSHHNHTTDNQMGIRPDGSIAHNGTDHWWDDQGNGNCWQDNTYSRGHQTDNFTMDPPSCDEGGSTFTPGLPVKDAGFLSCSQYDRNDETWRHPPALHLVRQPDQADVAPTRPRSRWPRSAASCPVARTRGRPVVRADGPGRRATTTCVERATWRAVVGGCGSGLVVLGLALVLVAGVGYAAVRTTRTAAGRRGSHRGLGHRRPARRSRSPTARSGRCATATGPRSTTGSG